MSTAVTNQSFADDIGVHFTTASKYRNGSRVASRDVCARIAARYRISLSDVVGAAGDGPVAFGRLMRERVFKDAGRS